MTTITDNLDICPSCGGEANNGFDRCLPPSPYNCTKCETKGTPDAVLEYMADAYFLVKSGLYYRPDARGYTNHPHEAGLYSKEDAEKHLLGCPELSMKPAFRIRAAQRPDVEVLTVEEIKQRVRDASEMDLYSDINLYEMLAKRYPNGLRIVKEGK